MINRDNCNRFSPLSALCAWIQKGWLYLKTVLGECTSGIRHVLEKYAGCADYSHCSKHSPILLVHGHTGHKTDFNELRRHLEKEEVGPIHVIQLGDPYVTIEAHAEEVREKVEEILKDQPSRTIRLVGASRGGIIIAYYTEYMASVDNVDVSSIITLAAPMQGTKIVDLLFATGLAPNDLCYLSDKMKKLHQRIIHNETTKYYHIASDTDFVVIPHHSAILGKDRDREFIVSGYSHNSLLYCPRVAEKIAHWLKELTGADQAAS